MNGGLTIPLADGLYVVSTLHFVAGFTVERCKIKECAPILRKRIAYWSSIAIPVETATTAQLDLYLDKA